MPDEEIKGLEEAPEEEVEPKPKPKVPLPLIIIAAVIFVVGIGTFSVLMGVFSSAPSAKTELATDSLSGQSADATDSTDSEKSELDKLEEAIFGLADDIDLEKLDELLGLEDGQSDQSDDDSLASANWLEAEKAKLASERAELDALKKQLDAREYQLKEILSRVNQVESTRIGALAKLYDGMKPAQVAPLITKLTDEQAVQILLKMKPASASKILGALNTERAARISSNMITFSKEN
jgi:flagellar motility protein MotE (MotC chaperone)